MHILHWREGSNGPRILILFVPTYPTLGRNLNPGQILCAGPSMSVCIWSRRQPGSNVSRSFCARTFRGIHRRRKRGRVYGPVTPLTLAPPPPAIPRNTKEAFTYSNLSNYSLKGWPQDFPHLENIHDIAAFWQKSLCIIWSRIHTITFWLYKGPQ